MNRPPRSAPYPMGEDQQTSDRQSQQRYPDWKRKLKPRKAHGDHRRIIQIEETRRCLVSDVRSQCGAQQKPGDIGSASLGQVHRATLRDGRMVAVKIQRPEVRARVLKDIEILTEVAELLEKHNDAVRRLGAKDMVTEFKDSILRELDYLEEAGNLATLRENLSRYMPERVYRSPADSGHQSQIWQVIFFHPQGAVLLVNLSPWRV